MSKIISMTTVGSRWLVDLDDVPNANGGTKAPLCSEAFVSVSGIESLWLKTGTLDTDWTILDSGTILSQNIDFTQGIKIENKILTGTYDVVLSTANDNTVLIGDVNNNGLAIPNGKEFKIETSVAGVYNRVASLDAANVMYFGSGNNSKTRFYTGGMSGDSAIDLLNGGNISVRKKIKIGSDGGTVFDSEIDIVDEQVDAGSGTAGIGIASYRNSDVWGSFVYGVRYRGTKVAPAACQNGDALMEFGCLGWDGANALGGGELIWTVDGPVSAGIVPSRAEILVTTPAGLTTNGLKINSDLSVEVFGPIKASGFSVGASVGIDHVEVINAKTFTWSKGILISVV